MHYLCLASFSLQFCVCLRIWVQRLASIYRTRCCMRVWIYLPFLYYIVQRLCLLAAWLLEQLEKGKRGRHIAQLSINSLERARRLVISNSPPALSLWLRRFCTLQVVHLKLMQGAWCEIEECETHKKCADCIAIVREKHG